MSIQQSDQDSAAVAVAPRVSLMGFELRQRLHEGGA